MKLMIVNSTGNFRYTFSVGEIVVHEAFYPFVSDTVETKVDAFDTDGSMRHITIQPHTYKRNTYMGSTLQ